MKNIYVGRKGHLMMLSGYRILQNISDMYKYNNTKNRTLNNGINPFNMDTKNIQHIYDLHMRCRNNIPRLSKTSALLTQDTIISFKNSNIHFIEPY